ncbi:MAG: hypothetical protein MI975_06660 [Cytophagales bacterium]|nr:hypothetical protein [Cytophagales bacterium]
MFIKYYKYQLTLLLFCWFVFPAGAQYRILENRDAANKVHQAIDSIYNLNFEAADIIIEELDESLGDYPGILLLKAFYINWKHQPIKKGHDAFPAFESYLLQGIEKSEAMLKENENDVEASFFLMACHAYLAQLYVNNGQSFKALGEAKSAYKYIKIGFEHTDENPEFFFSSGIYNYYREKYPEENPFYKSFLWFFRSGDMEKGIEMLKTGSEKSVFTQAECLTYLFHIYLRYEDNPFSAFYYSKLLKNKYPNNLHYVSNYIENSLRLEQYTDVLPYINRLLESEKAYYTYLGEIFMGIYLEKYDHNPDQALHHYNRADVLGAQDEIRVPHYDSMLFLGLGRIYKAEGDTDLGNQYLKKSVKAAEYKAYRKNAQVLLNK